jgi:arylsulfate sulfotransferase
MKTIRSMIGLISMCAGLFGQCQQPLGTLNVPAGPQTDDLQPLVFTQFWSPMQTTATDLTVSPTWQFCPPSRIWMTRPTGNGRTFLAIDQISKTAPTHDLLDEVNQGTDVVWTLSMDAVNVQLGVMGLQQVVDFNHDAIRFPNGWTAVLANNEMLMTGDQCAGVNTPPLPMGTCDVLGDAVVVTDKAGVVQWFWNAFDWNTPTGLPWTRAAVLGETCTPISDTAHQGCPITLASQANDWLHANSLYYDQDGNIIISLRHQDWVIKIAYENGTGDGHIVWRLGNQGDFALVNPLDVQSPWFSHQHDAERQSNGQLSLFDNGNTRHASYPRADSRGQAWTLNEVALTATLSLNFGLGVYSSAYGTAQLLSNGDWWFYAGDFRGGSFKSRMYEFTPEGVLDYELSYPNSGYRAFRLSTFFTF